MPSNDSHRLDQEKRSLLRGHPVLDILADRFASRSQPGQRTDEARVGLVVEGGGMRGAVTAGMITALEELGLASAFDDVYGSSVGAITAAFFLARQGAYGATTFVEDLTDSRFIDFKRVLRRKPIISLTYAYDLLTRDIKPLDSAAVLASHVRLHPIASCVETGTVRDLLGAVTPEELRLHFKAAACLPLIAGPPVEIDGLHYYDGGILDSVPFRIAEADGCTHIVVLQSWPHGVLRDEPSHIERALIRFALRRTPEFRLAYDSRIARYNADSAYLHRETANHTRAPALFAIAPEANDEIVRHLERRRAKILAGAIAGAQAATAAFTGEKRHWLEVLRSYPARAAPHFP